MKDGSYQIIEIKGDHLIDNKTVQAKKEAAKALVTGSNMIYKMIPGSEANNPDIVNPGFKSGAKIYQYPVTADGFGLGVAADSKDEKEKEY
jgi:hypothetical protein